MNEALELKRAKRLLKRMAGILAMCGSVIQPFGAADYCAYCNYCPDGCNELDPDDPDYDPIEGGHKRDCGLVAVCDDYQAWLKRVNAETREENARRKRRAERDDSEFLNYIVDLGSLSVMAADEDDAIATVNDMIEEGGWVEVDSVELA